MRYLGEDFKIFNEGRFLDMYRLKALLVMEDKLYMGKEHVDILIDEFSMEYDDIDMTQLECEGKIKTFDLLEGEDGQKYVVAHHQDFLKGAIRIIKEFAVNENAKVGMYYVTSAFNCKEYLMR